MGEASRSALSAADQPIHEDSIGTVPVLYFAGLDFGSTRKAGPIPVVTEEASYMMDYIVKGRADSQSKTLGVGRGLMR